MTFPLNCDWFIAVLTPVRAYRQLHRASTSTLFSSESSLLVDGCWDCALFAVVLRRVDPSLLAYTLLIRRTPVSDVCRYLFSVRDWSKPTATVAAVTNWAHSGQSMWTERERSGERTFQKTFERERNVEREAAERKRSGSGAESGCHKIGLSAERQIGCSRSAHMLWQRGCSFWVFLTSARPCINRSCDDCSKCLPKRLCRILYVSLRSSLPL